MFQLNNFTDKELLEINDFHMRNFDKFQRMFVGSESTLISCQNHILHIEVRVPRSRRVDAHKIAHGASKSWKHVPELVEAIGYKTWVYERQSPAGLALPAHTTPGEAIVAGFIALAKAAEHPELDVLLEVIEGRFQR